MTETRPEPTRSPWLRRVLLAVGAVVLLLVVAIGVFVATFDANRYNSYAVDWMQSTYQRTLAIDGPIELDVIPRLALRVSKVRLSEHGQPQQEFAAIDEAALSVQLWPLLSKQLVIDKVSARGVRARYERAANGKRNIDDLIQSKPPPAAAPTTDPPGSGGLALKFDVKALEFDELQLNVRDAKVPLAGEIAIASLRSGRLAQGAASPITLRASVQLTDPKPVALAFDGRMTLALDLERTAFSATDLALNISGDAADVKDLALAIEGAVAWDGNAVRAGPVRVALQKVTRANLTLAPSSLDAQRVDYSPEGERVAFEALKLAVAGRQADNPFAFSMDWPKLAVDATALSGSALTGTFKLEGANALAGSFGSGAPSGRFNALRLPGVSFDLKGQFGPRALAGILKADVLLDARRVSAGLEKIELAATLTDPGLQPLKLNVTGTAEATPVKTEWALSGALNANRFESKGTAALAAAVPRIDATARFDRLDLNSILAPAQPASTSTAAVPTVAPAAAPGTSPGDTKVQLDGLRAVDGRFRFTAGALAFRQYRIANAEVDATLDSGALRVARLSGNAWGGSIQGSGSANAGNQRIGIKVVADGVDVNAMLQNVAGKDLLEGRGRVTADVSTAGATVGALRSNLGGHVALQVRDGAVKGINLAQSFRQAKAALTRKADAIEKASSAEKTDFSELSASAQIANGVAQSNDLDVKSPFLRIRGDGRFDIGRGTVDYTARATVTNTTRGQGGAELDALRGVTVPVVLSGPFEAIAWKIQWSEVALAVIENQLKEKLQDKLMERLGGALGQRSGATAPGQAPPPVKPKDILIDQLKGLFN